MLCTIEWNTLSLAEWQENFAKIRRSNLLQSYDYASAICPLQNQKARWGVIYIDEQKAGLVQILEASILGNLLHGVILDRGPLWFDGFGTDEHKGNFIKEFRRQFPKRLGRKRRFIPEMENSPELLTILKKSQFQKADETEYQTFWINLDHDEKELLEHCKKNWRNMITRAEKENISVEWDENGKWFSWIMQHYAHDKAAKNYSGASIKTMHALAKHFIKNKNMLIGRAVKNGKPIASILHFIHGSSATYQIGWTGEAGRKCGAQHYLLLESCKKLKNKGIKDFDLGGYNDTQNPGIRKFKAGMGGNNITLAGLYS